MEKKIKKTKKDKKSTTCRTSIKAKKYIKSKKPKKSEKDRVRTDSDLKGFHGIIVSKDLTFIERLKLVRNCIILSIGIGAIFVFLKDSIAVTEEIDLIIIFSSIIFTLIAFLLFVFLVKCILDIKNGIVKIYKGVAKKSSDDILYSSYLPMCMITLDNRIHHVGINHYIRIKENDFIILRRTPITRCIVGLKIIRKDK